MGVLGQKFVVLGQFFFAARPSDWSFIKVCEKWVHVVLENEVRRKGGGAVIDLLMPSLHFGFSSYCDAERAM